jgi:transposase
MEILDRTNWPYFEAYKSSTTGEIFKEFVHIMKKLDDTGAGSHFFVMDSAAIRKTSGLKELFKISNHQRRLLPPYSPFLTPIEEYFSKLKTLVKRK